VACALDGPFIVLFAQDGADEPIMLAARPPGMASAKSAMTAW
jgi:hypothetical protein